MIWPASSFCADRILARRWSLLRNHRRLNTFRTSKTEGPSSSILRTEGEGGGPGAGGEGGAGFDRLAGGAAGGTQATWGRIYAQEGKAPWGEGEGAWEKAFAWKESQRTWW